MGMVLLRERGHDCVAAARSGEEEEDSAVTEAVGMEVCLMNAWCHSDDTLFSC